MRLYPITTDPVQAESPYGSGRSERRAEESSEPASDDTPHHQTRSRPTGTVVKPRREPERPRPERPRPETKSGEAETGEAETGDQERRGRDRRGQDRRGQDRRGQDRRGQDRRPDRRPGGTRRPPGPARETRRPRDEHRDRQNAQLASPSVAMRSHGLSAIGRANSFGAIPTHGQIPRARRAGLSTGRRGAANRRR